MRNEYPVTPCRRPHGCMPESPQTSIGGSLGEGPQRGPDYWFSGDMGPSTEPRDRCLGPASRRAPRCRPPDSWHPPTNLGFSSRHDKHSALFRETRVSRVSSFTDSRIPLVGKSNLTHFCEKCEKCVKVLLLSLSEILMHAHLNWPNSALFGEKSDEFGTFR